MSIKEIVWRGENGPESLSSRLGSYSFSDSEGVAQMYAQIPNERTHSHEATHCFLIKAEIEIQNPVFNIPSDPMIDFSDLVEKMGEEAATQIFLDHQQHVMNTCAWSDEFYGKYKDVAELIEKSPTDVWQLCVNVYPLLDCKETVQKFKEAGFDGAVHAGNALSMDTVEYKVFDKSQIRIIEKLDMEFPDFKRPLVKPPSHQFNH